MLNYTTTMICSQSHLESLLPLIDEINAGLKRVYVWYHTKIDPTAIEGGYKPNDGVIADVVKITPTVSIAHDDLVVTLIIDVIFTADDDPGRFKVTNYLSGDNDTISAILGFTAFPIWK